ncbi:MAG: STM4014 family protein [Eubacterium sp.]|nr:STM4014 family protein [Eubacterium sp.]
MREAVLLGNAGTKRTDYFRQAAQQEKLPVFFVDWKDYGKWKRQLFDGRGERLVKIDPPLWKSCSLGEMNRLVGDYIQKLDELSQMAKRLPLEFFNHPQAIQMLLDKRACKKKLQEAGLAVTEMLEDPAFTQTDAPAAQLVERMRCMGACQVFIKPLYGSGAAGVSAFRIQPKTGRMALYTCAVEHPVHGLVNTKRLRCFTTQKEVFAVLNRILEIGCIIERWYAKAQSREYCYDLRAVVLDGRIEFLLGRLSKGPITNLHLNNHPLEVPALGIPDPVLEQIAFLCKHAAGCFPGLRCAGIDLLLEKGSLRPRIIEMNAQGDLMYQDIFHENRIYRREAQMMKEYVIPQH